jgi:hypothetical protein
VIQLYNVLQNNFRWRSAVPETALGQMRKTGKWPPIFAPALGRWYQMTAEYTSTMPIAARRLCAVWVEVVDNQLVKMAHFQRKRRAQYIPVTTQLCVSPEWRYAPTQSYRDLLNHANAQKA